MSLKSRESHCGNSGRTKRIAFEPESPERRRAGQVREVLPELRTLEHLAEFSPRHAAVLRSLTSERADDRRRQTLMEWCDHVRGGGSDRLDGGRTADRDAGRSSLPPEVSGLLEWDPAQPRAPKGQADGGQWVGKNENSGAEGELGRRRVIPTSVSPNPAAPNGGWWVLKKGAKVTGGGFDRNAMKFIAKSGQLLPMRDHAGTNGDLNQNAMRRASGATPLDTDLNGASTLALGHHWVAISVAISPAIYSRLSKGAREFVAGAYSGPTDPPHGFINIGGVTHYQYNKEVKKELERFIEIKLGKKGKGRLSLDQMVEFGDLIESGRGADGKTNVKIKTFNDGIKAMVKGGAKPRPPVREVVKRGKALRKNSRYRDLLTGGLLATALSELLTQHAQAMEVAARTHHLPDAVDALRRGDVNEAERLLVGNGDSLYQELLSGEGASWASGIIASDFYIGVRKLFSDPTLGGLLDDSDGPPEDEAD